MSGSGAVRRWIELERQLESIRGEQREQAKRAYLELGSAPVAVDGARYRVVERVRRGRVQYYLQRDKRDAG